jgi:hypothetical protein
MEYVELAALRAYLSKQYAGMGGATIANHRKFCDHIAGRTTLTWFQQKTNGSAKGAGVGLTYTLVPKDEIGDYLVDQYSRRMNGAKIAAHRHFLRNVPVVTLTDDL